MVLVDSSVWSEHLRRHDPALARLLEAGEVCVHPFVIGEIACGVFPRRRETLALLGNLPCAPLLGQAELLAFIERHALAGRGIGFVDIHLLASALVVHAAIRSRDKRLAATAALLGCLYPSPA